MRDLYLKLTNCFGIISLDKVLSFQGKKSLGIYSPNGSMKSSLAKTFKNLNDISIKPNEYKNIYDKSPSVDIKVDNVRLQSSNCVVIESFQFNMEDLNIGIENSTALLLDNELKNSYDGIFQTLNGHLAQMSIDNSGYSVKKFVEEIESLYKKDFATIIEENLEKIQNPNDNGIRTEWSEINLKKLFKANLQPVFENNEVKQKFAEYRDNVTNSIFFSDAFSDINFFNIKETLSKENFFQILGHQITISNKNDSNDIKSFTSISEIEHFLDEQIGSLCKTVKVKLANNEDNRIAKEIIDKDPSILIVFNDFEEAKKKLFLSYLASNKEQCQNYLHAFNDCKSDIENIENEARNKITDWKNITDLFNKRFSLPITIKVNSSIIESCVLGTAPKNSGIPTFDITITNGVDSKTKNSLKELEFLSTGELKALHILRALFDIEKMKKINGDVLIVFDDIVDSFDYKNKHSFIQYLKELLEKNSNFYFLILTHNFDFFRNLVHKEILIEKTAHIGFKKDNKIILEAFDDRSIIEPFKKLNNDNDLNSVEMVAAIAFLRSLLEIKNDKNDNYQLLTKMLHIQSGSDAINLEKLKNIYDENVK